MVIDIKISSEQTIEHEGKQYRPVAIRHAEKGETYMSSYGDVVIAAFNHQFETSVILEEVILPYRIPTDEDAKQRPMAEFWDVSEGSPYTGILLAVIDRDRQAFVGHVNGGVSGWEHCRIPNEQKA